MMKRSALLFTVLCLLLCMIPSVGMFISPTVESVGNERMADMPSLTKEDGSFNNLYPSQLGDYCTQRFALRPQMITMDAKLQSGVFRVSNLDTVTVGTDGWLYYTATLDDFLGRNNMSPRQINATAHNLKLAQEYVESSGATFIFTVAPNKNTLYPENMPYYYSKAASDAHDRDAFNTAAAEKGLSYCNLFDVFGSQDEVLYLKQDSHWNNKGALLAYNAILDEAGKPHDDYSGASAVRKKDFYGDLQKMLYPAAQQPEYNYDYDIGASYTYVTPTKSVEEAIIKTENSEKTGSLYMYRDSFGNALLPYFANAYGNAYFTKAFPVNLALDTLTSKADTVIFEIAERNIAWFAQDPPVMPSPERSVAVDAEGVSDDSVIKDVKAGVSKVNMQYLALSGTLGDGEYDDDSVVYIRAAGTDGIDRVYEAFDTITDNGDGFLAYIPAERFAGDTLDFEVIIEVDGKYQAYHTSVEIINDID